MIRSERDRVERFRVKGNYFDGSIAWARYVEGVREAREDNIVRLFDLLDFVEYSSVDLGRLWGMSDRNARRYASVMVKRGWLFCIGEFRGRRYIRQK